MGDFEHIQYQVAGGLATVCLNRPDKLNALNGKMAEELYEIVKAIGDDPEIKVFLIKGQGRAFSAGVDLKETSAESFSSDGGIIDIGFRLSKILESMNKVTIAQIHGHCYTGALELALMFDMIFCSHDTQFADTHAKWGIMPRWGMTQRLSRRVGINKAKELTFRALKFDGKEAASLGLANASYPENQLDQQVQTVIKDILENSQEAIAAIKMLYNQGWATTLKEGLALEQSTDPKLLDTSDLIDQFDQRK